MNSGDLMHCTVTTVNNTVLYTLKWASQVVLVVKNPPANMGDIREAGSVSGLGRSPGGRHGNLLHRFLPGESPGTEAWKAAVHRFAQSNTTNAYIL